MENMERLNKFQKQIIDNFSDKGITDVDVLHFTDESYRKVASLGLPNENCNIVNVFGDADEPNYHRRKYCLKNCGLKCLYPWYHL